MAIRTITTTEELAPWLPSDYSSTGWTAALIQAALDDGNDPRLIAAEVWEEYAQTLPATEEDGGERTVSRWTNIDVSVEYGTTRSPREQALWQARFHRSRSKVKSVRLKHTLVEGEPDERPEA